MVQKGRKVSNGESNSKWNDTRRTKEAQLPNCVCRKIKRKKIREKRKGAASEPQRKSHCDKNEEKHEKGESVLGIFLSFGCLLAFLISYLN